MEKVNQLSRTILLQFKDDIENTFSITPFLRYIGNKLKIAPYISQYFPKHTIYIEPFMGSAAVFFYKKKAQSNVLNDTNNDLINMFEVVRDCAEEVINWIWFTPVSEDLYKRILSAYLDKNRWNSLSKFKRAVSYFYIVQLAYNEDIRSINSPSPSKKIEKGQQKWNNFICQLLINCSKKLDNVIILNRNYVSLIKDPNYNRKDAFWYMDPPYTITEKKKYYSDNFSPHSHHNFSILVKQLKCKWMISYDNYKIIRNFFKDYFIYNFKNFNNEIIITNYDLKTYKKQISLLNEDLLI